MIQIKEISQNKIKNKKLALKISFLGNWNIYQISTISYQLLLIIKYVFFPKDEVSVTFSFYIFILILFNLNLIVYHGLQTIYLLTKKQGRKN